MPIGVWRNARWWLQSAGWWGERGAGEAVAIGLVSRTCTVCVASPISNLTSRLGAVAGAGLALLVKADIIAGLP